MNSSEDSDSDSESDSDDHSAAMDIVLGRARLSDVDSIVSIFLSGLDFLDFEDRDWIEGVVRKRSKRVRIYVARLGNEVAGFILLYKKRDKAYMDAFAVDQRYRGIGIGKKLLSYVEDVLKQEGVEKLYLTVKNNNNNALGMYIKHGYRIVSTVLVLESLVNSINGDGLEQSKKLVKVVEARDAFKSRVKLLDTSIWTNFTWDADSAIYKAIKREQKSLVIYIGKRLAGVVALSTNKDHVVVERLAVSYYMPAESIKIVINAVKEYIEGRGLGKIIRIPVDSTKATMLQTLISLGFRIVYSEYVLCKNLADEEEE
ncbi:MAG: GNAT family N-acetyltransferase [Ignisphaera sp.]|nr:GNAT family N-acetyltransferase [Ignisphaera sp.]